jgi:hypothetical protein
MSDYINILSNNLKEKYINLKELGINNIAWKYEDILELFENLGEYIVLGGDVYKYTEKEFCLTYDNWYCKEEKYDDSIKISKEYIVNYNKRNGNDYIYSIVVVTPKELKKLKKEENR